MRMRQPSSGMGGYAHDWQSTTTSQGPFRELPIGDAIRLFEMFDLDFRIADASVRVARKNKVDVTETTTVHKTSATLRNLFICDSPSELSRDQRSRDPSRY